MALSRRYGFTFRLVLGVVLCVALVPQRTARAAKGKADLLKDLASGTVSGVLGNKATAILTDLGIFDIVGFGGGPDPVIDAKLNQIIKQLETVQADLTDLKSDVAALTSTVISQSAIIQLQPLLHDMETAATRIQLCAQQVTLVAQGAGTDAADEQMRAFALQMVGRAAGPCDLTEQFSIIHQRIVTDPVLGSAANAFYALLARVARENKIEYERVASHFIQYSIIQRQALTLIRGAYTLLGEPENLRRVLTEVPTSFLAKLRDEEIAFLVATDTYITSVPPPYDPSPAELADAIVQRLEGRSIQVTSYSLGLFENSTALSPALTAPTAGATPVPMADKLEGLALSYYGMGDKVLTISNGSCLTNPPSHAFSYVRPFNNAGGGFKIGSSCDVHVARHLLSTPPTGFRAAWTINGRWASTPIGDGILRNAATLAVEMPADGLAIGADPAGRASGFSAFTVVVDPTDPSQIRLSVRVGDLVLPVGAGTAHAFAAPAATAVALTRVPYGPEAPDRYALKLADGKFVAVNANGFLDSAASETWFDFQPLADERYEITTGTRTLYVNVQAVQYFRGESPENGWVNGPNVAGDEAAVRQWTVPSDGVPRVLAINSPTKQLYFYPPCLDGAGIGRSAISFQDFSVVPSTRCSDNGYTYVTYDAKFTNQDTFERQFRLELGGAAVGPAATVYNGGTVGGAHCYIPGVGSPFDHVDTAGVTTQPSVGTATGVAGPWYVNVPANGSTMIRCQVLDLLGTPAISIINHFKVQPCKGSAGGTCTVYP